MSSQHLTCTCTTHVHLTFLHYLFSQSMDAIVTSLTPSCAPLPFIVVYCTYHYRTSRLHVYTYTTSSLHITIISHWHNSITLSRTSHAHCTTSTLARTYTHRVSSNRCSSELFDAMTNTLYHCTTLRCLDYNNHGFTINHCRSPSHHHCITTSHTHALHCTTVALHQCNSLGHLHTLLHTHLCTTTSQHPFSTSHKSQHSTAPHSTVAPHSDWLRMDPCTSTALHCTSTATPPHTLHLHLAT